METTLNILLILSLLSIVVFHIHELIESHKYYKRLKVYHEECMKEILKNDL